MAPHASSVCHPTQHSPTLSDDIGHHILLFSRLTLHSASNNFGSHSWRDVGTPQTVLPYRCCAVQTRCTSVDFRWAQQNAYLDGTAAPTKLPTWALATPAPLAVMPADDLQLSRSMTLITRKSSMGYGISRCRLLLHRLVLLAVFRAFPEGESHQLLSPPLPPPPPPSGMGKSSTQTPPLLIFLYRSFSCLYLLQHVGTQLGWWSRRRRSASKVRVGYPFQSNSGYSVDMRLHLIGQEYYDIYQGECESVRFDQRDLTM